MLLLGNPSDDFGEGGFHTVQGRGGFGFGFSFLFSCLLLRGYGNGVFGDAESETDLVSISPC